MPESVPPSSVPNFVETLSILLNRHDLSHTQMTWAMEQMLQGAWDEASTAAFLIALRMKGETPGELAAAAGVLRRGMVRLPTDRTNLLDTCGTGGDGTPTFNISTAAALVAAGAGVPVVKHGTSAVSSRSGSADVLAALGVRIEPSVPWAQQCLQKAGLGFCFAPHFHPLLAKVAPLRRRLGVRTLLNCLGPLANPAGAAYQLLGVGRLELLDPVAGALSLLGARHALVVCSLDGMDEVSLSAPTEVREVRGNSVTSLRWTPADFGLGPCAVADLMVSGPAESAAIIRAVLEGEEGPASRIVTANAAAALLAAEHVATLSEGVQCAQEVLISGKARRVLERLKGCSIKGQ